MDGRGGGSTRGVNMKTLFVIDLMPFLYRGHFVFLRNPRMTATGINTSALMGFANGVGAILSEFKPTHAALAMDPSGPTFRHEAYPPYKAQREKMPEDLAAAIPQAFELADALNLPVIRKEGFEADDVMGTIAARAAAEGFEVFVATPDKDAAQLVGPSVKLYRPAHGKEYLGSSAHAPCSQRPFQSLVEDAEKGQIHRCGDHRGYKLL